MSFLSFYKCPLARTEKSIKSEITSGADSTARLELVKGGNDVACILGSATKTKTKNFHNKFTLLWFKAILFSMVLSQKEYV